MRFLTVIFVAASLLATAHAQPNTKKGSNPLSVGITRNQQELQELSTLIGQNRADMQDIVTDTLTSLTAALLGVGAESAFGQSPRETIANLISSFQKLQGAIETKKAALDGDAWLALSGQLKLTLDLIGGIERPIGFANTLIDLLVKTAKLVSLARQNANLVAVEVQVARAQTYLLAKAAAIQARRGAAQKIAAQSELLPHIKTLADLQSQWLRQQYKDRPQVIQLAVKTAAARSSRAASQVISGIQAAGGNSDAFNLSKIPGINPDVIAAMNRCNQIALTMVQRQANLTAILDRCPKPAKPGDDPPPCPAYESAAASNGAINRSSMTCNKDSSGQYIPIFGSSSGVPRSTIAAALKDNYRAILRSVHLTPLRGGTRFTIFTADGEQAGKEEDTTSSYGGWVSLRPGSYVARVLYYDVESGGKTLEPYCDIPFTVNADKQEIRVPYQYIVPGCSRGTVPTQLLSQGNEVINRHSKSCGEGYEVPPGLYRLQFSPQGFGSPPPQTFEVELKVGETVKVPSPWPYQ